MVIGIIQNGFVRSIKRGDAMGQPETSSKAIKNFLFFQLMVVFICITLIMASMYIFSYMSFINSFKSEILNNANRQFRPAVDIIDNYIDRINTRLMNLCVNEPEILSYFSEPAMDINGLIYLPRYIAFLQQDDYQKNVFFFFSSNSDYIIQPNNTCPRNMFFENFFNNATYNENFWTKQMDSIRGIRFYPASTFTTHYISLTQPSNNLFVPIAFKITSGSNFILVTLLDINTILNSSDTSYNEGFFITDLRGNLIYPEQCPLPLDSVPVKDLDGYKPVKNGYVISHISPANNIIYHKFVPNTDIIRQVHEVELTFILIIICSILISILISSYISFYFSRPIKNMISIAVKSNEPSAKSRIFDKYQNYPSSLSQFCNIFQRVITQNVKYENEINSMEKQMDISYYQARLKCLNTAIQNPSLFKTDGTYIVILFKIHNNFQKPGGNIQNQLNISMVTDTLSFKMLLSFPDSLTFSIGDDEIVSIINLHGIESIYDKMCEIIDSISGKFKMPVTCVISRKLFDASELNDIYKRLSVICMHRHPVSINQILEESTFKILPEKAAHLSLEQAEHITELIISKNMEETDKYILKILKTNINNELDHFYFNTLCMELINVCFMALNKKSGCSPAFIDTSEIFEQYGKCSTYEQYVDVCIYLVHEIFKIFGGQTDSKRDLAGFVKKYIEEHYSEEIYLESMADMLKISKAYLSFYFKSKTGINFVNYLNSVRIRNAVLLLSNTQMKIEEVASRTGFANLDTFRKTFKKYAGSSPMTYKRNNIMDE